MNRVLLKLIVDEAVKRQDLESRRIDDWTSELFKRIKNVEAKEDQLVLREIYAANVALKDALATNNEETKRIRLEFAEDQLLKNTELDPRLSTGGIKNTVLIARANHALFVITCLRSDLYAASQHLQRAFEADPRTARSELFTEFYEKYCASQLGEIEEWYRNALLRLEKKTYRMGIAKKRALGTLSVGMGTVGLVGGAVTRQANLLASSGRLILHPFVNEDWFEAGDTLRDTMRAEEAASVKEEFEKRIDQRCLEVLRELFPESDMTEEELLEPSSLVSSTRL